MKKVITGIEDTEIWHLFNTNRFIVCLSLVENLPPNVKQLIPINSFPVCDSF